MFALLVHLEQHIFVEHKEGTKRWYGRERKVCRIQELGSLQLSSSLPSFQLYKVEEGSYILFPSVTLICKKVLAVKLGMHPPN